MRWIGIALLLAACSGDGPPCDGNPIQIVPPQPGEEYRYLYLSCDESAVVLGCAKPVNGDVACDGDHTISCCRPR